MIFTLIIIWLFGAVIGKSLEEVQKYKYVDPKRHEILKRFAVTFIITIIIIVSWCIKRGWL